MVDCPWDGCDYTSDTKHGIATHHSQSHGEKINPGTEDCPHNGCDKSFENKHGVTSHYGQVHGGSAYPEYVVCDFCGDDTKKKPAHIERDEKHFCDKWCYADYQNERIDVRCEYCGKPQKVSPSVYKYNNNHFCGEDHRDKYWSIDYFGDGGPTWSLPENQCCTDCGEDLSNQYRMVEFRENEFCNRQCLERHYRKEGTDSWNGYIRRYSNQDWDAKRNEIRKRDQHRCQSCWLAEHKNVQRYGTKLDVHHIIPNVFFNESSNAHVDDNLISLCKHCHRKHEANESTRKEILAD